MKKTFFIQLILLFTQGLSHAQNGKIGINTSTPAAMLHVKDSSVLFSGVPGVLPAFPGDPPASGAGTRMMWYPDKAAFRAGRSGGAFWDKNNIGDYSFAAGIATKAIGENSMAMGAFTVAAGTSSVALNYFTSADGINSTAMGSDTRTIGENSIAMGQLTTAVGESSISMGVSTKTTGTSSTSMGQNTVARAYSSLSIGRFNDSIIASSPTNWVSTDPAFIIGNGTTINDRSNAFVVYKNGNTTLEGKITRPSTGSGNNLLPICYGSVSNAGAISSGTVNFSVNKTSTGQYEISITGELYSSSGYTANITVNSFSVPRIAVTSASAGNLLVVRIWDIAGALVDAGFHFIVYKQ